MLLLHCTGHAKSLNIITHNAVIDGEVKFAQGTVFQQPPNTKSQTLLGCLKSGIPLDDFVLGGERGRRDSLAKREREKESSKKDGANTDERQVCRNFGGSGGGGGGVFSVRITRINTSFTHRNPHSQVMQLAAVNKS